MRVRCPLCNLSWPSWRAADEACPHWDYEQDPQYTLVEPLPDDDQTCTWDVRLMSDGTYRFDNVRPYRPKP